MRPIKARVGLALALLAPLLGGCGQSPIARDKLRNDPPPPDQKVEVPDLVRYLNDNAKRVQAVQSTRVAIDARQGRQPVSLDGMMVCQKPRNFRLTAKVMGNPAVDLGSNSEEFWYWISKANPPYVYHCSYRNLAKGNVRLPFPFQPDMLITALGIGEYDPDAKYELRQAPKYLELIESTTSPAGQPVQKITVFSRYKINPPNPQVIAHVLKDARGKLICQATVHRVKVDRGTNAILPTEVTLEWPEQEMKMTLRMDDVQAVPITADRAARLFQRNALSSYDSYDLARGVVDSPGGVRRASTLPPVRRR
jgi:hypothetical protein